MFPLNTNIGMVTIGLVDPCKAGCTDLMLGCACHAWPTSNKTRLILASQPLLTTCPPPPSSPPSPPSPPSPQCYINAGRWYVVGPKFRNRQRKVRSETVENCELDTIGQNRPQIGLLKNQTNKRIAHSKAAFDNYGGLSWCVFNPFCQLSSHLLCTERG